MSRREKSASGDTRQDHREDEQGHAPAASDEQPPEPPLVAIDPHVPFRHPILPHVSRAATRVILSVVALAAATAATRGAATVARPVTRSGPITVGYLYADQCPAAGIAKRVDRWHMYTCNCTSYVAWALVANGQRIDWFEPGAMDARNWPNVARRAGLRIARTPALGDVAVWPTLDRPFGHVAYVAAISANGRFVVGEYNLPSPAGLTRFVFDLRTSEVTSGLVFIVVPRTKSNLEWEPHSSRMRRP